MLTDRQMDAALEVFRQRMQDVTDFYYRRMGEHIRDIGTLAPSDVHRLQQLRRMSRNLRDVKKKLAEAAGMNVRDLEVVLQEAAKVDDRVARKTLGVTDASVRLRDNVPLQRALRAQYAETAGRLANLSNTTVDQGAYHRAVDAAVTAVQSGAEDYESAIRRTLRKAGEMGLRVRESGTSAVEYASGNTRRVDTAVRMNVLDAMRRMNQRVMEEVGQVFGADGVEIDAHMLCAEDHLPYQGQQYSNEEFQQIQDSLARPFGEWNCRHTWQPIILGVSPRAYTDDQLAMFERYSTEPVEIDGTTRTRYEWSQVMRRMETEIRAKKDTATLAAVVGDDQLRRECQGSVNAMVQEYERLSDRTGLGPDFRRTYVAGFKDAKESAAMARGDAVGQWPAGGSPISAKDYQELKSYADERGIRLRSFENFDGDIGLVKEFIDGMYTVAKDFPEVNTAYKGGLQLVNNYHMSPNDYADAGHHSSVNINSAAFRNREKLEKDYAERVAAKWFPAGTTYRSIAYHEMGHVVHNAFRFSASDAVGDVDLHRISLYAATAVNEGIAEAISARYSGSTIPEVLTIWERCGTLIAGRRH